MEHFTSNVARIEQIPQVKLAEFPSPQISSFLEVQSLCNFCYQEKGNC